MRILLADDHILFRDALIQFIKALKPTWEIVVSDDFDYAYSLLEDGEQFNLILLDIRMPGMNGLKGLEKIVIDFPDQHVAILSGVAEEDQVKKAMRIGAQAYFPKTLSGKALVKAILYIRETGQKFIPMSDDGTKIMPAYFDDGGNLQESHPGLSKEDTKAIIDTLTKRELEVLGYLAKGLSNKEIGHQMNIQVATVKLHVGGVCKKLNVENRTQAAIIAHQCGL